MGQIHERFLNEQVRVLFQSYRQRKVTRNDLQELLGIENTRFFTLFKTCRQKPQAFSVIYSDNHPAGYQRMWRQRSKAHCFEKDRS